MAPDPGSLGRAHHYPPDHNTLWDTALADPVRLPSSTSPTTPPPPHSPAGASAATGPAPGGVNDVAIPVRAASAAMVCRSTGFSRK